MLAIQNPLFHHTEVLEYLTIWELLPLLAVSHSAREAVIRSASIRFNHLLSHWFERPADFRDFLEDTHSYVTGYPIQALMFGQRVVHHPLIVLMGCGGKSKFEEYLQATNEMEGAYLSAFRTANDSSGSSSTLETVYMNGRSAVVLQIQDGRSQQPERAIIPVEDALSQCVLDLLCGALTTVQMTAWGGKRAVSLYPALSRRKIVIQQARGDIEHSDVLLACLDGLQSQRTAVLVKQVSHALRFVPCTHAEPSQVSTKFQARSACPGLVRSSRDEHTLWLGLDAKHSNSICRSESHDVKWTLSTGRCMAPECRTKTYLAMERSLCLGLTVDTSVQLCKGLVHDDDMHGSFSWHLGQGVSVVQDE